MTDSLTSDPSAAAGTTIRFFISSTFADFQVEREVLQRRVFPTLRQLCARAGYRLEPIDLRWGVSEQASTARQTLRICLDELERCRQVSPDFFLLILLGNRYGSHILPPTIPADVVARLVPKLTPEERRAFAAAYQLDENAIAPGYVLLEAEGPPGMERTKGAEDKVLHQMLVRAGHAAGLSEEDCLPFEGAATHREIVLGLLGQPPDAGQDAGVLCALRSFPGIATGVAGAADPTAHGLAATYLERDDARARVVERLRAAVVPRLPAGQVLCYDVPWGDQGPVFDEEALVKHYLDLLRPRLEAVIAARRAATQRQPLPDAANARFVAERLAHFVGREEPLAAVSGYLAAPATVPLLISGPGGVGKSTLLARTVTRAMAAHPGALLLARYVGVTPGAESTRALLDGLRAELAQVYGREVTPVREDYERAEAFHTALGWATAARPLILVLDALDQLGPPSLALDWLPQTLPPHVHLVASLIEEDDRPELGTLLARQPAPQLVRLESMGTAEGGILLEAWLRAAGRTLRPAQRAAVLAAFEREGRPLYLRLAFEEARRWRSFDEMRDLPPLDPTIPGILRARFGRLERPDEHGPVLTGHTLSLLRAAKNGLAEDELLDVLARDDAVRQEQRMLAPFSPPIDPALPLPAVLWARLYADLAPYLTERETDGARLFTFYHHQLAQVAEERYLRPPDGPARHQALARYFGAQPFVEGAQPNLRKLSEQPTQEAAGGLTDALDRTLTDICFLEQKIAYQGTAAALDDLALAPPSNTALRDIAAAIRLGAHVLDQMPAQVENQLRGRLPEVVRAQLHDAPVRNNPWLRLDSPSLAPVGGPLVRTLAGYSPSMHTCAFSPDGRLVLSASGEVRLRDVTTGRTVQVLRGHTGWVSACAFSPDGHLALTASADHTLRLWDVASGRVVQVLAGQTDGVFSPDGRLILSTSGDYTLRLWDMANGQTLHILEGHTDLVLACVFNPDGRLALSASADSTLRLWDVATGQTIRVLRGHTGDVKACAFSPDGRLILSGATNLRLWETATGALVHVLKEGHSPFVFSPDGRLILSAGQYADHKVWLWNAATGQAERVLDGHTEHFFACAFSPDGRLALTGSQDHTLRLWDVASGEAVCVLDGHTAPVKACAFGPGGRLALSADDHEAVSVWDVTSAWGFHTREKHAGYVTACAFSSDGHRILSASADRTLRLWDAETGQPVRVLRGHYGEVLTCALSPDGRLALSASADSTLRLWDVETGQPVRTLKGPFTGGVSACAFSPDGRLIVSGHQMRTLILWDVASGRTVHIFEGEPGGSIPRMWSLGADTRQVSACAFSPDGRFIAASSSGRIQLWDVAGSRVVRDFNVDSGEVRACTFSPDGRFVLEAFADRTARLWDIESNQTVPKLTAYRNAMRSSLTDSLRACAFSRDGQFILSASWDHTLRLWDVATDREVARFDADAQLESCAVSPHGWRVVAGDELGAVHILTVSGMEDRST